eukprot:UN27613
MFCGANLFNGKIYTLITSALVHGNVSHLAKELTILLPLSFVVEDTIGGGLYIMCFFVLGIIGCILSYVHDRIELPNDTPPEVVDLIWSRGASANVYGTLGIACIACCKKVIFGLIGNTYINIFWMVFTLFGFDFLDKKTYVLHVSLSWCNLCDMYIST